MRAGARRPFWLDNNADPEIVQGELSENSRCDVRAEHVEEDDETVRSAVGSEALREQLDVSIHH